MNSLNRAELIGNITADIEVKQVGDTHVANFSVATNRNVKDESGEWKSYPEYHSLTAWGKLAESLTKFLHKGIKVYVEGRLQTRSWDGDDGKKRYKTEIVVERVIPMSRKKTDEPTEEPDEPQKEEFGRNFPSSIPDSRVSIEDVPF